MAVPNVLTATLQRTRPPAKESSAGPDAADSCSCGVAVADRQLEAYNEEAFRYLLDIERKRSGRSGRPFLLLLLDLVPNGSHAAIDPATALQLFAGLRLCLRETDVVGWYVDRRVAAAVLTDLGDVAVADVSEMIARTAGAVLRECLPPHLASGVRIRVHQHPRLKQPDARRRATCL